MGKWIIIRTFAFKLQLQNNMILHLFKPYSNVRTPEKMNNPFDYEPHPLCIQACLELQAYLKERKDWREEIDRGKMFGVLIVELPCTSFSAPTDSPKHSVGYLTAYSGQIGGRSDWDDFVPAVFDYLQPDGYFKTHEAEITRINQAINRLEKDERMNVAQDQIALLQKTRSEAIAHYQAKMKEAKAKRDARRQAEKLSAEEEQNLIKESQFMKAELRRLKKSFAEKTTLEVEYADYLANIARLKQLRKQLSDTLQQWLFSQFRMLNPQGERKDLLEIFRDYSLTSTTCNTISKRIAALKSVPPAGSGECCEPKLLQYAYEHGYRPLQMAMFWWGESPKEEIRHHLQFYPACQGKCKPILHWMLPEMNEELGKSTLAHEKLETLYEDQELTVICKPAGMLSVPGKTHRTSVYSIMRKRYPTATGPLIVHRLDMATSGLMVIAKTDFAYHKLQEQFALHLVRKRYVAIIGIKKSTNGKGNPSPNVYGIPRKGIISIPLLPDYLDRPRQIVSHEQGKEAITEYEVIGEVNTLLGVTLSSDFHHLRLVLYPQTGRTHQLRVHCAHQAGLNAPILGDPLYGNEKASRLYLHAEAIRFHHPLTGKEIYIERKADF